jgi:hypothetical protein
MIKKTCIGVVIVGFSAFWWYGFSPHLKECLKMRAAMEKKEGRA